MKNIKKNLKYLHIYLISVGVLVLSLASWLCSVEKITETLKSNLSQVSNLLFTHQTATLFNSFDDLIRETNDEWSVYKKSSFSKIDKITTYFVTGEIPSSQVILGTNGWLFYCSQTDGNSIEDFEGTNNYTESELNNMYQSALKVQTAIENRGIKFAILVPPNKENVYSEYMPDTYRHSDFSRTDLMVDYLLNKGINIISPKDELLTNHNKFQLYYSYDTHWNQLGAYIGVKSVLNMWDIELPDLEEANISAYGLDYHYCAKDDLAQILGMESFFSDEVEYIVNGTKLIDWSKFEDEQNNLKISYFYNDYATRDETILVIGDSFRSSTIPSLREQFSDVYVVHRSYFTSEMIDEINPNYIIVEYVERYSNEIKNIDDIFKLL